MEDKGKEVLEDKGKEDLEDKGKEDLEDKGAIKVVLMVVKAITEGSMVKEEWEAAIIKILTQ